MLLPDVREKTRQSCERNWNDQAFRDKIKQKSRATCLKRFGVEHVFMRADVRQKAIEQSKTDEARQKSHETMKKNGTHKRRSSLIEDDFFVNLCKIYGADDIERQKFINHRWHIDFYIRSIDVYVQFDGVYWHGLNRSIEEIRKFKYARDVQIYRGLAKTQQQNEWFKSQDLKLVRITDAEYREQGIECLRQHVSDGSRDDTTSYLHVGDLI